MGSCVRFILLLVFCIGLTFAAAPQSFARGLTSLPDNYPRVHTSPVSHSFDNTDLPWPTCVAVHQTPEITAQCNQFGQMGMSASFLDPCDIGCTEIGLPCADFMSPPGSGIEYLYWGGIWIGGVVGTDTLVSVSLEGWVDNPNLWFVPAEIDGETGLRPIASPAEFAVRALFSDTGRISQYINSLNVEIAMRSHSWSSPPQNKAVVYDLVIRNIGSERIKDGCMAIYVDADIGDQNNFESVVDDLTGSLRADGIAYVIDNDGDPGVYGFGPMSPRRLMAAKYLKSSVPLSDTTYNWWQSGYGVVGDYGPRLDDSLYRDFGTGGTATPEGAANKYYIMTKPEWDFDQIYTQHTDSLSQDWLTPPPALANDISNGMDSRFLLSIGKFDLPPDSSVRILFTTFTGAEVHRDPLIMEFLPYYPDFYRLSLNFADVRRVARAADSLAEVLIDPLGPVSGLNVWRRGTDSAYLSWDPQCFDNIDGYDVCVSEVDPSQLPYPGTLPPWLTPESLKVHESIGPVRSYVLDTTLNPDRFYMINVVMRSASGQGDLGLTAIHRSVERSEPPTMDSRYAFFAPGSNVTLHWQPPVGEGTIDHYNIYRLDSFRDSANLFHPFYDRGWAQENLPPADSLIVDGTTWYYYAVLPWATADGGETSYTVGDPTDSSCYMVSAVSEAGFESDFSSPTLLFSAPARERDVIVLTKSSATGSFANMDSVISFYHNVLGGLNYDLYTIADSAVKPLDWPWWLDLMPYRLVIVDDDLKNLILRLTPLPQMRNYLNSGGQLMVCGSLFEFTAAEFSHRTAVWNQADSIGSSMLGIDSIFNIGIRFYHDSTTAPYLDTIGGFVYAEATDPELPGLPYDTTRNPFQPITETYWPISTAPIAAIFAADSSTTTLYRYRSRYPDVSRLEDWPVGVKKQYGPGTIYTFGVHLWYLDPDSTRTLIAIMLDRIPTDIENENSPELPERVSLYPNFPNPFNPTTTISYSLPTAGEVRIEVFNLLGQKVRVLVDDYRPAGTYEIEWDGRTDSGSMAASGVYFYRLATTELRVSRKMLLVK